MSDEEMKTPKMQPLHVYDAAATYGEVKPVKRRSGVRRPYDTRLDNGKMYAQLCCKCFKRTSQGMCSGHAASLHASVIYAQVALQESLGLLLELQDRQGKVQEVLQGLLALGGQLPAPLLPAQMAEQLRSALDVLRQPLPTEYPRD